MGRLGEASTWLPKSRAALGDQRQAARDPRETARHVDRGQRERGEDSRLRLAEEAVIKVTAPLQLWTGENGSWHMFVIPEEQSDEIRAHCFMSMRGFKSSRVEATIDDVIWRTSVFPMKSGGYFLPVKAEVRREANIAAGDEVTG